jgi:hypothetical protein
MPPQQWEDSALAQSANDASEAAGNAFTSVIMLGPPQFECVAIPLYSAVDHLHDYVVQARGAFDETVLGILKLKDRQQRVEVRVVLHSLTAPRIEETCRWLSRNLPFVDLSLPNRA